MPTTWIPKTQFEQRSWLLSDGSVVDEPPLEMTPSGRKVRVAGTDMSMFSRDIDSLVYQAVEAKAKARVASVWMPLIGLGNAIDGACGYHPATTKAKLHVVQKSAPSTAKTIVWWRFRHATLPIEALLTVQAGRTNTYYNNTDEKVSVRLTVPRMAPYGYQAMYPEVVTESSDSFHLSLDRVDQSDHYTVREFIRDNPADWATILGEEVFSTERHMVEALLTKVREADSLASIEVPDLRDPSDPGWLELDLYETNLNSDLITDMTDYLEGTPSITEALRLYQDLRQTLRSIGMVLDDRTENDFQRALLNGDASGVTVKLEQLPNETGDQHDANHTLTLNLATGTFIVNCSLNVAHRNEVADRWEESLAVASLTGEEDALLAYAREYGRTHDERRAQQILRERQKARKAKK